MGYDGSLNVIRLGRGECLIMRRGPHLAKLVGRQKLGYGTQHGSAESDTVQLVSRAKEERT